MIEEKIKEKLQLREETLLNGISKDIIWKLTN